MQGSVLYEGYLVEQRIAEKCKDTEEKKKKREKNQKKKISIKKLVVVVR